MSAPVLDLKGAPLVAPGLRAQLGAPGQLEGWWLDHPDRKNAVTPAALRWMAERCDALRGQAVVVAGAGNMFCAGFDLTELAAALGDADAASAPLPDAPLIAATEAMSSADATFVAAVERYAIGAGVELTAACDFRIFAQDAWLRVPAGKLGVVYHAGGLRRIQASLGPQVTLRLVLAGEKVLASELDRSFAATDTVATGQTHARAVELANAVLAQDPDSVRHNRRMLRALRRANIDRALLAGHDRARVTTYARARERSSLAAGERDEKP